MIAKRMFVGIATAGSVLVCWVGCQAPLNMAKTKPGELPAEVSDAKAQPRLSATTYFAHGHLLERQGQFERAIAQYRAALKLRPEFISARNRLGITLNKLGKHAEATQEFEATLLRNPGSAYVHNNLGFSLYLEGRLTEAAGALERALELRPTFARARMNHGVVLAKMGQFDEAFEEFALAGTEADAYYNLAMIQADAGLHAEAAQALEAALLRNPKLEPARQKLAEVAEHMEAIRAEPRIHSRPRMALTPAEPLMVDETTVAADVSPATPGVNLRIEPAPRIVTPDPTPAASTPVATAAPAPAPVIAAPAPQPQKSVVVPQPKPAPAASLAPSQPIAAPTKPIAASSTTQVPASAIKIDGAPRTAAVTPVAPQPTPAAAAKPEQKSIPAPSAAPSSTVQASHTTPVKPQTPAATAAAAPKSAPQTAVINPTPAKQNVSTGVRVRRIGPDGKELSASPSSNQQSIAPQPGKDATRIPAKPSTDKPAEGSELVDELIDAVQRGESPTDAGSCKNDAPVRDTPGVIVRKSSKP